MSYQSFLSQDEVDALLAGVTGEGADTKPLNENLTGVRAYDLTSPDRVVRHRMQTLELINERFARRLRSTMLSFMRRNADITVGSIRIQKYSDFELSFKAAGKDTANVVGIVKGGDPDVAQQREGEAARDRRVLAGLGRRHQRAGRRPHRPGTA